MAGHDDSKLSVTVAGSGAVEIIVDNKQFQGRDNSLIIPEINPGYHTVKVYRKRQSSGNRRWSPHSGNNGYELLYQTTLNIRPRQFVDIMINRFGKALIDERSINWNEEEGEDRYEDCKVGNQYPNNHSRDDRDYRDDYVNSIRDEEFARIREQVKRNNFENSRRSLVKQVVERNYLSSQQVRELLQLFSLENNKMELAKVAYRNTIDKRNYFIVFDVFSFSRSREELTQFIERYRD